MIIVRHVFILSLLEISGSTVLYAHIALVHDICNAYPIVNVVPPIASLAVRWIIHPFARIYTLGICYLIFNATYTAASIDIFPLERLQYFCERDIFVLQKIGVCASDALYPFIKIYSEDSC